METRWNPIQLTCVAAALALVFSSGAFAAQSAATHTATTSTNKTRSGDEMSDAATHINRAVQVLHQMQTDGRLSSLLQKSKGVFIVPRLGGAALGVGARGGAGVLLVRKGDSWGDPAFYNMGTVSVGAQAGVEAGPVAFVLNDQKAFNAFMKDNKFSLNANAGLTLVNWSREAQGNAGMGDITVWSGTEGLFGGVAISVTDVNYDEKETAAYYGKRVAVRDILGGKVMNPRADELRQA
ncbi:MAG TPA: lipid-binding SYLF domain-containing protein, partial [Telluria sp.]|nr:lipid-binding SYLF domain-containing protein [Telluria sp.]